MKEAKQENIEDILKYLRSDVGNCVYMYIDIAKYGLDNPNMKVWFDTDDNGDVKIVVMKYYDSIQIFTKCEDWDAGEIRALIDEYKPGMVSGQQWIIERIYEGEEDNYRLEIGYVFKLTRFREFDEIVPIERVGEEACREIAEFVCTNEEIGGYYQVDDLEAQLRERLSTGIGRDLVIRSDGELKGHIATYAEFDGIATTAGLLAVDDGTGIPYGTMLESRLVNDLLKEGFEIYTFVTESRRARFFRAMKCEELGRYGKMTIKER